LDSLEKRVDSQKNEHSTLEKEIAAKKEALEALEKKLKAIQTKNN